MALKLHLLKHQRELVTEGPSIHKHLRRTLKKGTMIGLGCKRLLDPLVKGTIAQLLAATIHSYW